MEGKLVILATGSTVADFSNSYKVKGMDSIPIVGLIYPSVDHLAYIQISR